MIVFFLIFGVGNSIYILSMIKQPSNPEDRISGKNIWTAFMLIYRSFCDDVQADLIIGADSYSPLFSLFFLFQTFLLLIVFYNLLTAVLVDQYT